MNFRFRPSHPLTFGSCYHIWKFDNWYYDNAFYRLGKLMRASSIEEILHYCEEFFPGEPPEYFFDRNPDNFPQILDMYRSVSFLKLN